jgi:hypothetical protein
MIEIKNLKKNYGKFVAIEDFNLEIKEGKTYGILGRINSGGTTIFNILCNYTFKDDGTVLIDGKAPEDARDLIYMCPKMDFYNGYTLRQVLKSISDFNREFDLLYAFELCRSFKLELDKKFKVEENFQNCTIFKTLVTICMEKKYLLFNKPEIGLSSLDIRKLSDVLMGNYRRNGYTPIIHSKNVNYFFDYLDYIIIIKDKKVVLYESREKLEKLLYSISASSEVMGDITKEKNVLVVRDVKKFSKLKVAYILAKDKDEIRENGGRSVSLKEIYEAITMSEGGH